MVLSHLENMLQCFLFPPYLRVGSKSASMILDVCAVLAEELSLSVLSESTKLRSNHLSCLLNDFISVLIFISVLGGLFPN